MFSVKEFIAWLTNLKERNIIKDYKINMVINKDKKETIIDYYIVPVQPLKNVRLQQDIKETL